MLQGYVCKFDGINGSCCCCCCWYWPPVCEVCPYYEVVEFQYQTLTTPDLGYVTYCYIQLLNPPHSSLMPSDVQSPQLSSSILYFHGIICPHGCQPFPSQHTNKSLSPHLISPVTTIDRLFLSFLALITPARSPSPPLPRCLQNLF